MKTCCWQNMLRLLCGVEILHERAAKVEEEVRKKAMVQIAFSTLSYSELEAIVNILGELKGMEGLLVASKLLIVSGLHVL